MTTLHVPVHRLLGLLVVGALLAQLAVPHRAAAAASDALLGEETLSGRPAVGAATPDAAVEIGGDLLDDGVTRRGQLVHDSGFDGTPWAWDAAGDPDQDPLTPVLYGRWSHNQHIGPGHPWYGDDVGPYFAIQPYIVQTSNGTGDPKNGQWTDYRFRVEYTVGGPDVEMQVWCANAPWGQPAPGTRLVLNDRSVDTANGETYTVRCSAFYPWLRYMKFRWDGAKNKYWWADGRVADRIDRGLVTEASCTDGATTTPVSALGVVYTLADETPGIPGVECPDGTWLDGLTVTREAADGTSLPARTLLTWDGARFTIPASVNLTVAQWERDTVTGLADYELTVGGEWLANPGQPCATTACRWSIAGWSDALSRDVTMASGELPAGTQTFTQTVSGSAQLAHVTHVSASVVSADENSTVGTGLIEVQLSDASLNQFVASWLTQFAGYSALIDGLTVEAICTEMLAFQGTHYLRSTTNDQYVTCEAGRTAGRSKSAILRDILGAARDPKVAQRVIDTLAAAVSLEFARETVTRDGQQVVLQPPPQPKREYEDDPEEPYEPETAAAGAAGFGGSGSPCIPDPADRQTLLESLNLPPQDHHILTIYDSTAERGTPWKTRARQIIQTYLDRYGLSQRSLGLYSSWNVLEDLPHQGPHPDRYKSWALDRLVEALDDAAKEPDAQQFLERFHRNWQYVRDRISDDPLIVRSEYWEC